MLGLVVGNNFYFVQHSLCDCFTQSEQAASKNHSLSGRVIHIFM